MELHTALKEVRRFHGATQEEVCIKFNAHPYPRREINKSILSKMENGGHSIRAEDLFALSDIYGLSLDQVREIMEGKIHAYNAVKTRKEQAVTRSFLIADGGYQGGILSFPIGARVLVNIENTPKNGDLVAIQSADMATDSVAVRKLTRSLGKDLLLAEDKNYPLTELNDNIKLVGVVTDVFLADIL